MEALVHHGGSKAAVLCHPHPIYGGNMWNNVIEAAASALWDLDWSTLRFNFRGVGRSQGRTGEGQEEPLDVMAAFEMVERTLNIPPSRSILVGYSFGAWVGLRALREMASVMGWVAISPPIAAWDFTFVGALKGRRIIISGDRDQFCPLDRLSQWVESLEGPKDIAIIHGADHFFWGHEEKLREELLERLRDW